MHQPPETVYGCKYDPELSTTEIAARIRAEIKAEVKAGRLPRGKYSVTRDYYSMGSSIDIEVRELPEAFGPILNPPRIRHELEHPHTWVSTVGKLPQDDARILSPKATALQEKLESMLSAYNYDGSDSMTDYYHVNFSAHVRFAWELERRSRAAILDQWAGLGVLSEEATARARREAEGIRHAIEAERTRAELKKARAAQRRAARRVQA